MGRLSMGDFRKAARFKSNRKISKWKDKGSTKGFVHPRIGLWERTTHGPIPVEQTSDTGSEIRPKWYNCAKQGCPDCLAVEFAIYMIENKGADPKELILDGGKYSYTLGQLAGKGDWRTDISAKDEFIIPWIACEDRDEKQPVELIIATTGLASSINEIVDSLTEEDEIFGDFMKNPYAMKLTYKKDEVASKKYGAQYLDSRLAPLTDDIKEIMGADEKDLDIDMESMVKDGTPADMLAGLASCWNSRHVTFDDFLEWANFSSVEKMEQQRERPREPEEESVASSGELTCPQCSTTAKSKFCPECGSPMKKKKEPEKAPAKEKESGGVPHCPECGKASSGKYCLECGALMPKTTGKAKEEPKEERTVEPKKGVRKRVCPRCKTEDYPTTYNRCKNCAEKFDQDVPM